MVEATALLLAERGQLDVDESVSTYVPDYRYGGDMTVDQVMRNVAGLPRDVLREPRNRLHGIRHRVLTQIPRRCTRQGTLALQAEVSPLSKPS
jgi:CubicO group peptidase (beta-lactamase class C family)